jgi:lipopolysaccharide assembly outer membrane protein LptD (OstA)
MNKLFNNSLIQNSVFFCITVFLLNSCRDIQEIDQFLEKNIDVFVERGNGIKMTYSDSAKIKMILTAPVLERYSHPGREKEIFDKGILVTFMGENSNPVSWLEANTAIRDVNSGKITTKGRVEFYDKNKKLESPELIWDENRQIVYTDKIVRVTDPVQGDTTYGFGFQADQNFTIFEIRKKVQGKININEFLGEK